jgi:ABC-2 type transport system permease protein
MRILFHVIRKEFIQLRRDRKMIPMLIGSPLIQLLVFGFAANLDVRHVPMVVMDRDHTAASRALVERFTGSRYFDYAGEARAPGEIDRALVNGTAQVALVIREGYGAATASGGSPEVQLIADGSEANSAVLGMGYASVIVSEVSAGLVRERLWVLGGLGSVGSGLGAGMAGASSGAGTAAAGGTAMWPTAIAGVTSTRSLPVVGRVELVPRAWYNPDLRSRWFYIPAILAMVLMLTTMVMPSMAVVREKEIGTLEQLIVTPVRSWQLIVGKLFPFAVIGLATTLLVTALSVLGFGVPLRGSLLLLMFLTALFLLSTLGLGLLASTLARNQQQAMMASIFLLMVPMIYLSGLIFPIENMPALIRLGTYGIPLRYYNTIIRGIFLKGVGLETLWPQALVLLAYGLGILGLASVRFRKRLD